MSRSALLLYGRYCVALVYVLFAFVHYAVNFIVTSLVQLPENAENKRYNATHDQKNGSCALNAIQHFTNNK